MRKLPLVMVLTLVFTLAFSAAALAETASGNPGARKNHFQTAGAFWYGEAWSLEAMVIASGPAEPDSAVFRLTVCDGVRSLSGYAPLDALYVSPGRNFARLRAGLRDAADPSAAVCVDLVWTIDRDTAVADIYAYKGYVQKYYMAQASVSGTIGGAAFAGGTGYVQYCWDIEKP